MRSFDWMGIKVVVNDAIPHDEAYFMRDGQVLGRMYNLGSVAAQRATIGRVDSSSAPDPLDGEQGQGFGGEDR